MQRGKVGNIATNNQYFTLRSGEKTKTGNIARSIDAVTPLDELPRRYPILNKHYLPYYKLLFYWCRHQESNSGPSDYKSAALPTELCRRGENYKVWKAREQTCGALLTVLEGLFDDLKAAFFTM
jgi:hypothetical protein